MNKYLKLFSLCLMVSFCGCKEKRNVKDQDSNIKHLSIDLSNSELITELPVFDKFDFVKLETTEESLLSGVIKVVATDSCFYVLSALGGDVMAFNKSGRYLFKLEKGRGPHEISYPTDIAFSETKQQLSVLNHYRTVKAYTQKGEYVESMPLNDVSLFLETVGDIRLFFDSNFDKDKDCYGQVRNGKEIVDLFFPKMGGKLRNQYNLIFPYPFFKEEQTAYVSCMFSDTVYMIDSKGTCTPRFVLDYHGNSMNQSKYFDEISGFGDYIEACKIKGYGSGVNDLWKNGNNLFFRINTKGSCFVVYDLQTDMVRLHKNLISGLPNIYAKAGGDSKFIYYSMTSSRLYNYLEKKPASDNDSESIKRLRSAVVSDEDNPVLLLCSMRKS